MTMMMAPSKAVLAGKASSGEAAEEVFPADDQGDVAEEALESALEGGAAASEPVSEPPPEPAPSPPAPADEAPPAPRATPVPDGGTPAASSTVS